MTRCVRCDHVVFVLVLSQSTVIEDEIANFGPRRLSGGFFFVTRMQRPEYRIVAPSARVPNCEHCSTEIVRTITVSSYSRFDRTTDAVTPKIGGERSECRSFSILAHTVSPRLQFCRVCCLRLLLKTQPARHVPRRPLSSCFHSSHRYRNTAFHRFPFRPSFRYEFLKLPYYDRPM